MSDVMRQDIDVLDKGYVRLVGVMDHFLTATPEAQVVNAARASYEKEVTSVGKRDIGLINYLIRRVENSPFRHSVIAYEVRAPLMVARQWWKYAIGSAHLIHDDAHAWNETSRRYLTEEPEFYRPDAWRSAPAQSKQGSGPPLSKLEQFVLGALYEGHIAESLANYKMALKSNTCAEQARLFLPAYGLYVRWRWTASLLAVLHFLDERLDEGAQVEMQLYARAVRDLTCGYFPNSFAMLEKQDTNA